MNSPRPLLPTSTGDDLPMPAHYMRLWGQFWDVVSLLIFGGALLSVLGPNLAALGWREAAVAVLILAQAGLYFRAITLSGWPIPARWLAVYFVGGPVLWLITCQLAPELWWLAFTYMGQMYGCLPPRAAIPGTAMMLGLALFRISDWDSSRIPVSAALGFAFTWLSGAALYLFIFGISRTSRERARLIDELSAARRDLELARQKDVELAALRERERLARDLHDNLGHALVAMSVQLEAIQRLYRVDPERGSAHVDELKALTRRSMDDLRRALAGLRASGLGERALSGALQTLSVELGQRAHLEVECQVAPGADALGPAVAETLWRVAQESLTNVEKHAGARRVRIILSLPSDAAILRIADDGVGLPLSAEDLSGHYGLRGMRERVEGLGGTLTLSRDGEGGTIVEASLPIIQPSAILAEPS